MARKVNSAIEALMADAPGQAKKRASKHYWIDLVTQDDRISVLAETRIAEKIGRPKK